MSSKIALNSAVFDLYPWLKCNLRSCSRPSLSGYSMRFGIPTLQSTACGVACMFRFLQINCECLTLYCDRVKQSHVNKRSWLSTDLWPQSPPRLKVRQFLQDLNFPLSQILNYSSHRRPRLSDFDFPHLRVAKKKSPSKCSYKLSLSRFLPHAHKLLRS